MAQQIQIRRDLAANWTAANPTLAQGEIGYETDTLKMKVGTGAITWNLLAYFTAAGGGGSALKGSGVSNFGATPGTNVVVTTVANVNVVALSKIMVFIDTSGTATHNSYEHKVAPIKFSVDNIVPGVSFDVTAVTDWRLDGTFNFNYLIV